MGLLGWLTSKFPRLGAPKGTSAPVPPDYQAHIVANSDITDRQWYSIPRSTAVDRIKFTPAIATGPNVEPTDLNATIAGKDYGTVSVIYRDGSQVYDSVATVPRSEFYALAFAQSVGRYLEILFWPVYSQNPGKHRRGMPGRNTNRRKTAGQYRGGWSNVPANKGNTGHRKV